MKDESNKWINLKEVPNLILVHIIISVVAYLLTLFTSIKLAASYSLTTRETWLVGIILFLIVAMFSYFVYRKMNKRIPSFRQLDSFDYEILEKEITHQYISMDKLLHKRKCILKALRNGLDSYSDKFMWTGDKFDMRTDITGHNVLMTGKKNVFNEYEYKFHKKLKKHETIEMEVIWELDNSSRRAVPFFSTTIEEPTKELKMNLVLPTSFGVTKAVCETSSTKGAKNPFESVEVDLNREGKYHWIIPTPKLLHHYEINWHLNNHTK